MNKGTHFFFIFALFFIIYLDESHGKGVIDLGKIAIEGEVRRPPLSVLDRTRFDLSDLRRSQNISFRDFESRLLESIELEWLLKDEEF